MEPAGTHPRALAAFGEREEQLSALAAAPDPDAIQDRGQDRVPRYWDYEFHGTAGGWDGHAHMGFVHHELVYRYLLVPAFGGDIFALRAAVAAAAPATTTRRCATSDAAPASTR